ncbi:MAG: DUF814 domain-containing protein [Candidatus Micrarchaeota archaeon]|nr:DUF814 domain-containing protein [Candidatus Micrarchaeota archaeon]
MEIDIDFTRSAQDNANSYYQSSKKLQQKKEGARKAIAELEKKLEQARKSDEMSRKVAKLKAAPKEWYQKFRWAIASDGSIIIGGRDASQNEQLNSRHFEDADLFFHADIFGASVVILKGGASSPKEVREETAQFAACYSSAWKEGSSSVDVYAMRREQVSKSTAKGSLGSGSFLLTGEREWYRSTPLSLSAYVSGERLFVVPSRTYERLKDKPQRLEISPGDDKKSDAAKKMAKMLNYYDLDEIMQRLPAGEFTVRR